MYSGRYDQAPPHRMQKYPQQNMQAPPSHMPQHQQQQQPPSNYSQNYQNSAPPMQQQNSYYGQVYITIFIKYKFSLKLLRFVHRKKLIRILFNVK